MLDIFITVDVSPLQRDSAALESGCHSLVWETVEEQTRE